MSKHPPNFFIKNFEQECSIDDNNRSFKMGDISVPIENDIIRFRQDDGYNQSFGLQWNRFKLEQYDENNDTKLSKIRLDETRWSFKELKDKTVLEAGSGAGRFTRHFAKSGAKLTTFDYSSAVDANRESNDEFDNIFFSQADIFNMPFKDDCFDYVFCHGVVQHTPDPKRAFKALCKKVKPGGEISIDVYRKDGLIRPWKSKYIWRPLTTRMDQQKLLKFLEWFIPKWLPIDTAIKSIPRLGSYLGAIIPCWNYMNTNLSKEQKVKWAIMDTFDALAPAYDLPATLEDVQAWFEEEGLEEIDVHPGGNGVVGNGRKPSK